MAQEKSDSISERVESGRIERLARNMEEILAKLSRLEALEQRFMEKGWILPEMGEETQNPEVDESMKIVMGEDDEPIEDAVIVTQDKEENSDLLNVTTNKGEIADTKMWKIEQGDETGNITKPEKSPAVKMFVDEEAHWNLWERDKLTSRRWEGMDLNNFASDVNGVVEVPIFCGDCDPSEWVSWIDAYGTAQSFSDFEYLQFAYGFVEGDALAWFNEETSRSPFHSWDDLRIRLFHRFRKSEWYYAMDRRFSCLDRIEKFLLEKEERLDEQSQLGEEKKNASLGCEEKSFGDVKTEAKETEQQLEKEKLTDVDKDLYGRHVFDRMLLRANMVARKKKKRQFTKAKRSRYKDGRGKPRNRRAFMKNKSKMTKNVKSYMNFGIKMMLLRAASRKKGNKKFAKSKRIRFNRSKGVSCYPMNIHPLFKELILGEKGSTKKRKKRLKKLTKKTYIKVNMHKRQEFGNKILLKFTKKKKRTGREKHKRMGNKHGRYVHPLLHAKLSLKHEITTKKLDKWKKRKQKHKITWSLPKNHVFILLNFRVKLKYSGNLLVDGYRVIQKKVLRRQQVKNMKICIKIKRNDGQELAKRLLVRIIKMKKRAKREKESEVVKSNNYINQLFFVALPLGNRTVKQRLVAGRKPKFNSSECKSKKQIVVEAAAFLCRIQVKLNQNAIISPCLMNALENRFGRMIWKLWPAEYKQEEAEHIREIIKMTYFKGAASFTSHDIILYYRGSMGNGDAQGLDCRILHSVDKLLWWMLGAGKQFVVIRASNGDLLISCIITWGGIDGEKDSRAGDDWYVVRQHWKTATRVSTGMKSFDMVLWLSCLPKERLGHLNQKHWKGLADDEFQWDWKGLHTNSLHISTLRTRLISKAAVMIHGQTR